MRRRLLGALACAFVMLAQLPASACAAPLERSVKAAFLYKFLSYVEWPSGALGGATAPIHVGVAGADDIADELAALVPGRLVNGHQIEVRRVQEGDVLKGLQVLFVGERERARIGRYAKLAQQHRILLVTESEGALADGSMINFLPVGDHVRFEVAMPSIEHASLRLSSRLLAVAERVQTGEQ